MILLAGSAAAADTSNLDRLADLMHGTFDTHASNADSKPETHLVDRRVRIDLPLLGDYVFYSQINEGEEQTVYRQRILALEAADDGRIVQSAYSLKNPDQFVDAGPGDFTEVSKADLVASLPDGCERVYELRGAEFYGRVDPRNCIITSSRTGKLRAIEAESILSESSLKQAERGFDAETGEKLFGTEEGEFYELFRREQ